MASVALVGCTGLVGSHILSTVLYHQPISQVDILARRNIPTIKTPQAKLTAFIDPDTAKWGPHIASLSPAPDLFISSLATTRGAVGGFENQYKIDHDMNIELAKAAKEAGSKVYVLISVAGATTSSSFQYTRMKAEIEEHIKELDFERTVIIRPGMITGHREESRPAEAALRYVAGFMGKVHSALKDSWAQDGEVIAKASVKAGLLALEGKAPAGSEKVWVLGMSDIIKYGRTEWKEEKDEL